MSVEKPLAQGVAPASGFKVVEVDDETPSKTLSIFDDRKGEECGACTKTFSEPEELF